MVNLLTLNNNFEYLRSLTTEGSFFCPMIKADAYGHGAIRVAKALSDKGVSAFGVVCVEEALELREAGIDNNILIFCNLDQEIALQMIKNNLTPVISTFEEIELLEKCCSKLNKKIFVHVKLNYAMNRLGFEPSAFPEVLKRIKEKEYIQAEGVCTHFPNSEDLASENSQTYQLLQKFEEQVKDFVEQGGVAHSLNSAGLIGFYERYGKKVSLGVRPGIALYGAGPVMEKKDDLMRNYNPSRLKPVLRLETYVVMCRLLEPGEAISYGSRWKASQKAIVGLLPIGYADGLRRGLGGKAKVKIDQKFYPLIGTICMDYSFVDLGDKLSHNEQVELLEKPIVLIDDYYNSECSAIRQAELLGTISYELLTGLNRRVPRVYKDGNEFEQ